MTAILDRKTYGAGDVIFTEGERADVAYIIQEGLVALSKQRDGQEVELDLVEANGIFGEVALIDDMPRMVSARALEPSPVVVISRRVFKDKLEGTDPFIRGLLNMFAANTRKLSRMAAS